MKKIVCSDIVNTLMQWGKALARADQAVRLEIEEIPELQDAVHCKIFISNVHTFTTRIQ